MKNHLTKAAVEAVRLPEKGAPPIRVWDTEVPGFGVKITGTGARIYELKYRMGAAQRWFAIGRHGEISFQDARAKALKLRGLIADGKDPAQARDDSYAAGTVAAAIERFLAAAAKGR